VRSIALCAALFSVIPRALGTEYDTAKRADDANESSAVGARIALGRSLLVVARATDHCIPFAKSLGHQRDHQKSGECTSEGAGLGNLHYGPHFTTRFAACSHIDSRSGPASCHPSGTGARRRFSPSLSKQSQPLLNSLDTTTCRWNGLRRRSGVCRRSASPPGVSAPSLLTRRSTFRRSAAAGVTSHTSHRLPPESVKVR